MDERVRFVARLLDGEKMAALCREFVISRKTGYKIFDRYKDSGLEALTDRSRRPWRYGNQLPQQVETAIACESLAFIAFHRLFQERGLPCSIRSDNGVPFGSPHSLFNLSQLPLW